MAKRGWKEHKSPATSRPPSSLSLSSSHIDCSIVLLVAAFRLITNAFQFTIIKMDFYEYIFTVIHMAIAAFHIIFVSAFTSHPAVRRVEPGVCVAIFSFFSSQFFLLTPVILTLTVINCVIRGFFNLLRLPQVHRLVNWMADVVTMFSVVRCVYMVMAASIAMVRSFFLFLVCSLSSVRIQGTPNIPALATQEAQVRSAYCACSQSDFLHGSTYRQHWPRQIFHGKQQGPAPVQSPDGTCVKSHFHAGTANCRPNGENRQGRCVWQID
jgi:hypothetical protein